MLFPSENAQWFDMCRAQKPDILRTFHFIEPMGNHESLTWTCVYKCMICLKEIQGGLIQVGEHLEHKSHRAKLRESSHVLKVPPARGGTAPPITVPGVRKSQASESIKPTPMLEVDLANFFKDVRTLQLSSE